MKKLLQGSWITGLLMVLAACGQMTEPATLAPATVVGGGSITVTKDATGDVYLETNYRWSIDKSVAPSSALLEQGQPATFSYTIEATRTSSVSTTYQVTGSICVTNTGNPVAGVEITDTFGYLDSDGDFQPIGEPNVVASDVTLEHTDPADPTNMQCFPYVVAGSDLPSADAYQNHATVTVGSQMYAASAPVEFNQHHTGTTSATATLTDVLGKCPEGFTCEPDTDFTGTWQLEGSRTILYTVKVTNDSTTCGSTVAFENTATLTPSHADALEPVQATVTIYTGDCEKTGGGAGCTPGYWRQEHHYDAWAEYNPDQSFFSVFGVDPELTLRAGRGPATTKADRTLGEAVMAQGGSVNALARHAVAALLNASRLGDGYLYTEAEIVTMVQLALSGQADIEATKDLLAEQNEMGCPLH
ncbi:MAG TPA: hypothetical protein VF171_08450 [Trueperaceae bacterium]